MWTTRPLTDEEIKNRFGAHKASIEGPEASAPKHIFLRETFVSFATWMNDALPKGNRESSLAFTHLEESSMWAHKAVAALDPVENEIQTAEILNRLYNMRVMAENDAHIGHALKVLGLD